MSEGNSAVITLADLAALRREVIRLKAGHERLAKHLAKTLLDGVDNARRCREYRKVIERQRETINRQARLIGGTPTSQLFLHPATHRKSTA